MRQMQGEALRTTMVLIDLILILLLIGAAPTCLQYVRPCFAFYDPLNCGLRHLVSFGYTMRTQPFCFAQVANLSNIIFSQLGVWATFAAKDALRMCFGTILFAKIRIVGLSAFAHPIHGVVGRSTNKEMIRSDARRVVASVQDAKAIPYRTNNHLVSEPVRLDRFAVHPNMAVSFSEFGACPKPAGFSLDYLGPKPLLKSDFFRYGMCAVTRYGTEFSFATFDVGRFSKERFVADCANDLGRLNSSHSHLLLGGLVRASECN